MRCTDFLCIFFLERLGYTESVESSMNDTIEYIICYINTMRQAAANLIQVNDAESTSRNSFFEQDQFNKPIYCNCVFAPAAFTPSSDIGTKWEDSEENFCEKASCPEEKKEKETGSCKRQY